MMKMDRMEWTMDAFNDEEHCGSVVRRSGGTSVGSDESTLKKLGIRRAARPLKL